jgi:hypothetical protein
MKRYESNVHNPIFPSSAGQLTVCCSVASLEIVTRETDTVQNAYYVFGILIWLKQCGAYRVDRGKNAYNLVGKHRRKRELRIMLKLGIYY